MGLFDTVRCEYPLPDQQHQDLEFQTKDLERCLESYTITQEGRLVWHARRGRRGPIRDIEWPLHSDVRIYAPDPSKTWIEYVVRFTDGLVEWIRPEEEVRRSGLSSRFAPAIDWGPESNEGEDGAAEFPGLALLAALRARTSPLAAAEPQDPSGSSAEVESGEGPANTAPDGEESLLRNLSRNREALQKLLAACGDHWGYEDPVYRFYHQSFKVYGLQGRTEAIVERLQALAPGLQLNRWFTEIVQSGTGKTFQLEDNACWPEVTRPILEAFFHARFFLEMAVRYGELEAPPRPLPSGYAALLYLYGLR